MKFDLKSIIVGVLIGSMGLTTAYSATKSKNINVLYNDNKVVVQDKDIVFSPDNTPFIYNDTAYAPINIIAENIGCNVSFDEKENTINIYSIDKSKIKLLEEAIRNIGAISPEKAIEVWAKGVEERSAALQYCVMTESFKETYVKSLDKNEYDFWITGVSSPWIEDYKILKINKINDTSFEYEIKFNTKTSEGDYNFFVTLTLIKEGDYWKISDIKGDKTSEIYTGLVK